jgi:hypothetical protein
VLRVAGVLTLAALAAPAVIKADDAGKSASKDGLVLLETRSFWRCRFTWGTDVARLESGELVPVHPDKASERIRKAVGGRSRYIQQLRRHERALARSLPEPDWTHPDFPDGAWAQLRGPFCSGRYGSYKRSYRSLPHMCLRGKFHVNDPAKVGDLRLSLSFLGGVVIYVNGRELTRAHLPTGKIGPTTPAEDYLDDVFFTSRGRLWDRPEPDDAEGQAAFEKRIRTLSRVRVPASMLQRGVNVLAIGLHRAPAPARFFTTGSRRYPGLNHAMTFCWWSRIGLRDVKLVAAAGAAARPNCGHGGRPRGFQVWTAPIFRRLYLSDYADTFEPLEPIRICAPRNTAHSGQVVVCSDQAIRGVQAVASKLRGPAGAIPASAVQIRYALADGAARGSRRRYFLGLERFPPERVPTDGLSDQTRPGGAVQPIWATVRVPRGAKAGRYEGTVTVSAAGLRPIAVPLHLRVVDWDMPDTKQFFTHVGLIQSPESVALHYGAPLWSEKHWKLLDRTFSILAELGTKVIWITAQPQTHFGNEHAMIPFIREPDGSLRPDMNVAERYLELAIRHLGRSALVILYCWRCPWATGHYGPHEPQDKEIKISIVDPDTGELQHADGPDWGEPECRHLWKPVFDRLRNVLTGYGMTKSLMIGTAGDYFPSDEALADLKAASGGCPWVFHAHIVRAALGSQGSHPTGYIADGWGGHCHHVDPEFGRGYGWKNAFLRTRGRGFAPNTVHQRFYLERQVTARVIRKRADEKPDHGLRGMGRVGADFWPVLRGRGGQTAPLAGRYPDVAWGQMSLRCCGYALLSPGRDGAIHTVTTEMLRENTQEIEARVFIEKVLHDPARRARLGEPLAARAQEILDERTRAANRATRYRGTIASGIHERLVRLYELAAEVAAAVRAR